MTAYDGYGQWDSLQNARDPQGTTTSAPDHVAPSRVSDELVEGDTFVPDAEREVDLTDDGYDDREV